MVNKQTNTAKEKYNAHPLVQDTHVMTGNYLQYPQKLCYCDFGGFAGHLTIWDRQVKLRDCTAKYWTLGALGRP